MPKALKWEIYDGSHCRGFAQGTRFTTPEVAAATIRAMWPDAKTHTLRVKQYLAGGGVSTTLHEPPTPDRS